MQFFVLAMAIVSSLVYPNYIQPLFNDFEELREGPLRGSIRSLAIKTKFPLDKILIMDGSKRSDHSNAYFFGMYSKRIVLYDTLIKNLTD
jgi:STE24 endopeptidase